MLLLAIYIKAALVAALIFLLSWYKKIIAMRKFYLGFFLMCFLGIQAAEAGGRVRVKGNHFVDPNGNTLVLRGLCFSDPDKLEREGQWKESYFAEAKKWGANVVRFAVHPQNLNQRGWDAYFQLMDQGISWAKKYGLYVIMDWHSIGNLKEEKFTAAMYRTTKAETFQFWERVASHYRDEPVVAFYELFNEPTVTAKDVGQCSWEEWRQLMEALIDAIRAKNRHAVCLVAGFNWAYDLTPVAEAPVRRENIGYISHPYPMKREKPWEEKWEKDFGFVAGKYPVVCTEVGFCLPGEKGAHVPVISDESYGEILMSYFDRKGISFTAWCFDTSWAPTLISDWDFTPTTQGRFFKNALQTRAGL